MACDRGLGDLLLGEVRGGLCKVQNVMLNERHKVLFHVFKSQV